MILSAALALVVLAQDAPVEMRLMRFPTVHGENVVFTYAGDLWVSKRSGGFARRLTSHPGNEVRARISPNGRWIAFTGQYDGNNEAYVIPIEGGEPRRLTYDPNTVNVIGWTPDNRVMAASVMGNFTHFQQRLWLLNPEGGLPIQTPVMEITEGSFSPDGTTLVYTRTPSYLYNWRRYRGGTQGRISFFNMRSFEYSELPANREQYYFPMWVGDSVFYISDKNLGTQNLYRYDVKTKGETQLTRFADADIRFPSTDGTTIVFERDGYLYTYDIATANIARLSPLVRSDFVQARPMLRSLGTQISSVAISPSGVRVAVEARGDIFSLPARSGETRNLTNTSGVRERFPSWSPNGAVIAYAGDETGFYEVYTRPQMGGDPTKLTDAKLQIDGLMWAPNSRHLLIRTRSKELYILDTENRDLKRIFQGRFGMGAFDVSPDSRWVAYINQMPNGFGAVHLYEIASGQHTRVSDGSYDDNNVAFDMNGRFLYTVSTRTFQPGFGLYEYSLKIQDAQRVYVLPLTKDQMHPLVAAGDEEAGGRPPAGQTQPPAQQQPDGQQQQVETKIDFDDLAARAVPLPMGPSSYPFITGSTNGVFYWQGGTLHRFDMTSRESQPIFQGLVGAFSFNPARNKMAYFVQNQLGIVDVRPTQQVGAGRVDTAAVETVVAPRDEWRQIFWESWRFLHFNFYDPNMAGVDWAAMGKRYERYLDHVANRIDLNYVLGLMVGELGTGHAYVSGGDMGPMPPPIPIGQLGADYTQSGQYIRISRIYRGSNYEEARRGPLAEPGVLVNEGDYLLAIDGQRLTPGMHPNALLANKANRTVVLTVNDRPSFEGARQVRVRPIANESNVRYVDWVEGNRRLVDRLSGGRIGYMHIPNTATEGAIEFIRGYYRETDKHAVIVDERWNGGGFIQPWFVETLARRIRSGIQQRHGEDTTDAVAIEGPMAMLINHYAGSGGDFFPWMFRQQGLGPLIGTRTWGGLVGISGGAPLIDGGSVTAPEFSLFDRATNTIIAENVGVDPDIHVDFRPDLVARGQDPQLQAAIDYLLKELAKLPPRQQRQTIPRIDPAGRIGGR